MTSCVRVKKKKVLSTFRVTSASIITYVHTGLAPRLAYCVSHSTAQDLLAATPLAPTTAPVCKVRPNRMNVVLVLVLVVCGCVCEGTPQHTTDNRDTLQNTEHISGTETQLPADTEREIKGNVYGGKSEIVKGKTHNVQDHRLNPRSRDIQRDVEARIFDINERHAGRGKLRALPGLARLKQDTPGGNTTASLHTKDCSFLCPQAESLAPCTCDPCARTMNCSALTSFEQLFDIFHTTVFPNPRFESFVLISPLRRRPKTSLRSDIFLADTFGDASFTSIWVESMTHLTTVEAGAFKGSEASLKSLVFKWNYYLNYFPFTELGNMEALEKLQVSGSSLTSLPALPRAPRLIELFLDNNLILSVPPKTFTQLSSLMYLDLAFNSLHSLRQDSLHLSHDVMVFLDHNIIAYIDERAFSGHLPTLLDVSSNALTGLDQRVFQPILDNIISHQYDSYVDATYNPLQCSSIHWLLGDNMYLYFIVLPDLQCRRAH